MPLFKKVGNFLLDLDKFLGEGQYGKVYLASEITDNQEQILNSQIEHSEKKKKDLRTKSGKQLNLSQFQA